MNVIAFSNIVCVELKYTILNENKTHERNATKYHTYLSYNTYALFAYGFF